MQREHELHDRRRGRNIGVLAVLLGFVAMLFLVTVVKLGGGGGIVGNPSAGQGGAWIDGFIKAVNPPEEQ
ncbi:MAG: cytochrome C oxidase assembly protein [Pseudomonadota bacterium]